MSPVLTAAQKGVTYTPGCDLDVIECGVCGISFAMPSALNKRALDHPAGDPNTVYFYCRPATTSNTTARARRRSSRRSWSREKNERAPRHLRTRTTGGLGKGSAGRGHPRPQRTRSVEKAGRRGAVSVLRRLQAAAPAHGVEAPDYDPAEASS